MRAVRVAGLGLLTALLAGCFFDEQSTQSTSWLKRFRQLGGATGPDAVYIEYVLVERPLGDTRLNQGAWESADEQVLAAETRAVVETNGFRVGLLGGLISSEVDVLLQYPKSTLGQRQRRLYAGSPA